MPSNLRHGIVELKADALLFVLRKQAPWLQADRRVLIGTLSQDPSIENAYRAVAHRIVGASGRRERGRNEASAEVSGAVGRIVAAFQGLTAAIRRFFRLGV